MSSSRVHQQTELVFNPEVDWWQSVKFKQRWLDLIAWLGPFHTGKFLSKVAFEHQLLKVSTFTLESYFRKKTFLCQRSTFESLLLSKVTFEKIEHVLFCESECRKR